MARIRDGRTLTLMKTIAVAFTASLFSAVVNDDVTVLYLSQYDAQVDTAGFVAMVGKCPSPRPLALTFTRYPKLPGGDEQVIGFGYSVVADDAFANCVEEVMLKAGAHP